MIFDILFLPLLFFISIIISYEDIKYGKVRNKWIILGLVWGLAIIFFFFIWYFIASPITHFYYFNILQLPDGSPAPVFTIPLNYLSKVILNVVIALTIAFLMWRFKAWAAGDAKLFMVYSLLIPLKYYWKSYLVYFPSFVLLINIFIPIFIYFSPYSALTQRGLHGFDPQLSHTSRSCAVFQKYSSSRPIPSCSNPFST